MHVIAALPTSTIENKSCELLRDRTCNHAHDDGIPNSRTPIGGESISSLLTLLSIVLDAC